MHSADLPLRNTVRPLTCNFAPLPEICHMPKPVSIASAYDAPEPDAFSATVRR